MPIPKIYFSVFSDRCLTSLVKKIQLVSAREAVEILQTYLEIRDRAQAWERCGFVKEFLEETRSVQKLLGMKLSE